MASNYSPGDFQAHFYHHDPYRYQYLNQDYGYRPPLSLGQSITKAPEHEVQAQSLQGLIQVMALISVSLFTSYINEKNNQIFQESLSNNNTNSNPTPTPAPMPVTINPNSISILFKVPGAGAGITFRLTQSRGQTPSSTGQTNDQGEFRTFVLPNVPIEVSISGTIDGEKVIDVTQTITPSSSVLEFVIPTVKETDLYEREYKVILTWTSNVLDLDLAALRISYGSCDCLHFFGGHEGPCYMGEQAVLSQDNILNTGIESLSISSTYAVARSSNSLARERYDIFVHNPEEISSIARSGAIITVLGGSTSKTVNVPTSDPNSNSSFWFVGSLNLKTGMFEEAPVSKSFVDLRTEGDCTELIEKNYGGISENI